MNIEHLKLGIVWYAIFLLSIVLHEASHAFVSFRLGDPTAKEGGQVNLNPLPHIQRELFGTVIIPIASYLLGGWMFGWASIPQDYHWAKKNPVKSAMVALAGPAANLFLVIFSLLIIRIGYHLDLFYAPETITFSCIVGTTKTGILYSLTISLSILFSLNLILFIFNLLPLPSFDGIHVIFFFVDEKRVDKILSYIHNPTLSFFSLIIAWNIFDYVFNPIHTIFVNLIYPGVTYS
ncbi:site-2 protease family protein [bacterium]|nr:site-2 protease family protein [bacterium]